MWPVIDKIDWNLGCVVRVDQRSDDRPKLGTVVRGVGNRKDAVFNIYCCDIDMIINSNVRMHLFPVVQ